MLPLAVIIYFWPVLAGKRFFFEDIVQQFYPTLSYLANSLKSLKLPYWTPYVFSGIPFINDVQSQTFYPPNWLFTLFIGPDGRLSFRALEIVIILHVLMAGLTMYKLGREWKLSRQGALYAALTFMLSGFMILRTIHLGVIYTYTWFPLIFLCYHRAIAERKLHYACAGGILCAVATLGGYPQTLMHMVYGMVLYALWFVITRWSERRWGNALWSVLCLAIIGAVGVGIAAAQLLPTTEYVNYTVRTSLSYTDLVDASLRPVQLISLLAPKFFGTVAGGRIGQGEQVMFWGGPMDYHYWETVIYVGVLPLFLVFWAFRDKKQPLRWYLLALAAIALVLALGKYTPLYKLALAVLPGFKRFRIPGRLSDLFTFGMCLLAGFGLDVFLRQGAEKARGLLRWAGIAAGATFLVWVLLTTGSLKGLLREFADPAVYAYATKQWGLALVFVLLGAALVLYRSTKLFRGGVAFWAVVLITFLDLLAFGGDFNSSPQNPNESPYLKHPALVQLQQESRTDVFRVNMRNERVMLLGRNQGNLDKLELLEGYTPLGIARYAPFVKPGPHILDLLNAKYKVDSAGRGLTLNPTVLPRARMVYRYQVAASDSLARDVVKRGDFDYRNSVVLEQSPGFASRESAVEHSVKITRRESNRMELDITTAETGILVLSEVFYPEWKARLDGTPVAIVPADYFLRGVTIPAGTHKLEMSYDGRRVRTGILISLVTLVLAIGLTLVFWRVGRRPEKTVDNAPQSGYITP